VVPVKNKDRLSEMTAISFIPRSEYLITDHRYLLINLTIRAFLLRFTSHNETLKNSLTLIPTTLSITMKWQPLPEGGIVLLRLLVAV